MLLPSTRVPVHARFWKACIVCGRGPCKSTASALLRTKGRRVARKASAAVCEHCGGMRTAPALHWVFGESWAWAGGHTRWAPRLWRHGTFVKDLVSCGFACGTVLTIVGRVCMHTARVLTKCPRVSLNTFCAATCSNLYHISHTHPVQFRITFSLYKRLQIASTAAVRRDTQEGDAVVPQPAQHARERIPLCRHPARLAGHRRRYRRSASSLS
jgi:hypothetical protein